MKRFLCLLCILSFLPVFSLADPDLNPIGRWSISSDYSTMHENLMFAKTDFFLFEDGSVYRVSITKKRKENKLTICYDDGVWLGDRSGLIIRVGDDLFNAFIDDDGFLYLWKNEDDKTRFFRVGDISGGM